MANKMQAATITGKDESVIHQTSLLQKTKSKEGTGDFSKRMRYLACMFALTMLI